MVKPMAMSNAYIKKEIQGLRARVSERRERQRQKDEHRRSVAAVVDFASNMFSMLGNAVKRNSCLPGKTFYGYDFPIKDFNGEIAGRMFRARFSPKKVQRKNKNVKSVKK